MPAKNKNRSDSERVIASRKKYHHVQVLFKKEHRAQIRLIAKRRDMTFVAFLEQAMDRIIADAKRQYGRQFARLLDAAKDASFKQPGARTIAIAPLGATAITKPDLKHPSKQKE